MTTQETIALVSALIAAISVSANIILSVFLYRHKKRDDEEADRRKQREAALATLVVYLRPLLSELERTNLFNLSPEDEIWEFGFVTLSKLAELCASAHIAGDTSSFVDQNLRTAISGLHHHVKVLRGFQDSWRDFSQARKGEAWRALQQEWPDLQAATAALQAARPVAERCKLALSHFLRKQGSSA
jgi:hypothetical protein